MGGAWPHQGALPGQHHQHIVQLPTPGAAAARMLRSGTDQVPACRHSCLRPQMVDLPDYAPQASTTLHPAAAQSLWGGND